MLLGAGGFQLYDGIVQHKLLGLHQIRYHVTIWPYDLTWDIIAFIMIVAGVLLMKGRAGAIIGIDRIRRRPGTRGRLSALFIAAAGHDTLAKLMYAWMLPAGGGPAADRRRGRADVLRRHRHRRSARRHRDDPSGTSPPAGPLARTRRRSAVAGP